MFSIEVQNIHSPRFAAGCFAVLSVYCVFIIIATSAIFEEEINLDTPDIQSANNFPWEISKDDAVRVGRRIAKPIKNVREADSGDKQHALKEDFPVYVQGGDSFVAEQLKVQKQRKSTLSDICQKNPRLSNGDLPHDTLRHIYVHEQSKLLYCFVPKVACSNWKRVLMKIGGNEKPIADITSNEAHFHNGMKRLVGYSEEERREKLRTYKKFMFARNPFVRILSAYKNKYQDKAKYMKEPYFHRFAIRIMKNYRQNPSEHDIKTGEGITWDEFAQYLADPKQYSGFDDHWEEIYRLCSPCRIPYDFIGKLETITDDAKYILKSLNVDDKVSYPTKTNSHPTNSTEEFQQYYARLDKGILERLWEIYQLDFELFGYKKPSNIN